MPLLTGQISFIVHGQRDGHIDQKKIRNVEEK